MTCTKRVIEEEYQGLPRDSSILQVARLRVEAPVVRVVAHTHVVRTISVTTARTVPEEEEVSVEDDEGLTLHGSGALLEQASAATQLQPSDTDAPCVYALLGSEEFFGPWDPVSVDAFVRHRKPARVSETK